MLQLTSFGPCYFSWELALVLLSQDDTEVKKSSSVPLWGQHSYKLFCPLGHSGLLSSHNFIAPCSDLLILAWPCPLGHSGFMSSHNCIAPCCDLLVSAWPCPQWFHVLT